MSIDVRPTLTQTKNVPSGAGGSGNSSVDGVYESGQNASKGHGALALRSHPDAGSSEVSPCASPAQSSGSEASKFPGVKGELNKGASGEGKSAAPDVNIRTQTKAPNGVPGRAELPVSGGQLFPGIHD